MTGTSKTAEAEPGYIASGNGTDYFRRCLGRDSHHPVGGLGKYQAAHPVTIRRVYEEALTRFPEAADVIASLVFWEAIDRNRDEFLREFQKEATSNEQP